MIFQVFSRIYFIIKIAKRGLFNRVGRRVDVARPHRHTQTPTWRNVTSGLASDGPTG